MNDRGQDMRLTSLAAWFQNEARSPRIGSAAWVLLAWCLLPNPSLRGWQSASATGARIFPATTHVFVQVPQPDQLIQKILSHPLRSDIETLEPVRQALNSPQMKQGRLGLAFLETRIGEKWLPALKKLTDHGLFIGAELSSESVGIAFQSSDEALLKKTAGEILGFIKQQVGEDALQISSYRGGKLAELDQITMARFGNWFLISNQGLFARQMADHLLDGVIAGRPPADTLAARGVFEQAWQALGDEGDARIFADLEILRQAPQSQALFAGSTDNPGVELLFGGILEALKDADFLAANLTLGDDSLTVRTTLPCQSTSFQSSREFYFGNRAEGRAPLPLEIPGLLAQVASYRDLGRWWLSKEALFPERVIAELALADSQLSTFFGGADFGEEILGALQPGLHLVAKAQTYPAGVNPDIKLPALAIIGRLQNPARETRFRISFNSFITLLNLSEDGNMPQFDVQTMNQNDYRITFARYLVEEGADQGLLHYNFSPAIAFQDDYMIISSTEEFAHELAKATQGRNPDNAADANTWVLLDGAAIQQQLAINKQSLVAQSMVESGKPREQATAEIELALSLLDYLRDARLDYCVEAEQMTLEMRLRFQQRPTDVDPQ